MNLRTEPVLFQRVDDDCVPYSVRRRDRIHNMVVMGDTKDNCDHIEACIRKEVGTRRAGKIKSRRIKYVRTNTFYAII